MPRFLAIDLGAESGRGVVGTLTDDHRLTLSEVHRFPNTPVRMGPNVHWDLPRLMAEVRIAIARAAEGGPIDGVGVDTWGVDFGLIGPGGELVGLPVHYRDPRTNGWVERVYGAVSRESVYAATGIQTMPINTLFQLAALADQSPRLIDAASQLLFLPDLIHYYLTGHAAIEYTIASTSQMLDASSRGWATDALAPLGLPLHLLGDVVPDGAAYGGLLPDGLPAGVAGVPVIAPGGHDTACAVAAVPAGAGENWAYLSSGTWSLLGLEIGAPILTPDAAAANVTNEGGVAGTIRLLKNIGGLWLVQECRRHWAREGREYGYDELTRLAADAPPLGALVDPDDPSLLAPSDMPDALRALCAASHQPVPDSVGALVRCCLDSLGAKYQTTVATLERLTGHRVDTLHVVGGGSQNRLLNQIAADATGRTVVAGPVEATAIGNVLLQAKAHGLIGSLPELRRIVADSFPIETFTPDPARTGRFAADPG